MANDLDGHWDWHHIFYRLLVWVLRGVVGLFVAGWAMTQYGKPSRRK